MAQICRLYLRNKDMYRQPEKLVKQQYLGMVIEDLEQVLAPLKVWGSDA